VIEEELPIKVLGYFPQKEGLSWESRHLGLRLPTEMDALRGQLDEAAKLCAECIDKEALLRLAGFGDTKEKVTLENGKVLMETEKTSAEVSAEKKEDKPVLAVAMDEVFCFYYEDNLKLLEETGIELAYFSPLHDKKLPKGSCGILLGGGYPEIRGKELCENTEMISAIREAIRSGMPSVAECGGFMYLHQWLQEDENNASDGQSAVCPMVGVVEGECKKQSRLVRFGYVDIYEKEPVFLGGKGIKGHEFHYYDSDRNGESCEAYKTGQGKKWDCIHVGENHWWGYPHLFYRSNPEFVRSFVKMISDYAKRRETL